MPDPACHQAPYVKCQMPDPAGTAWGVVASGAGEPAFNMALDDALLEAAPNLGKPILRWYSWTRPAATFGYSQRFADVEPLTPLRPLIRRPTGGGVVPHDHDWTYTLVFPPTHPWYALRARDSYARLHGWVQAALARVGLETILAPNPASGLPTHCFVRAEQFDVLHRGAKIAGAAQRRTRTGLLIQGSVHPPADAHRTAWESAFTNQATDTWAVTWEPVSLPPEILSHAARLAHERYAQDAYNRRR